MNNKNSEFPAPIPLPVDVYQARRERSERIIRSAFIAIVLRIIIVCAEFLTIVFIYSSSLLMDGLSSLIDVIFSLILIICIKLAGRPPDEEHPFGHGRYEPLVGLQSGIFLIVIGGVMFVKQLIEAATVSHRENLDHPIWIIPLIAVVLLEIAYRVVISTAKKQNSPALAADAAHYRVDMLTSLFAMIALLIANLVPEWATRIDQLGALVISAIMVILGFYASKENFHQIVDKVPDQKFFGLVDQAAKKVDGVKGVEKMRIQLYGPDAHVDIDIEVNPDLTVDSAHKITQEVRVMIQKDWPAVKDVMVHVEPYYPGDH